MHRRGTFIWVSNPPSKTPVWNSTPKMFPALLCQDNERQCSEVYPAHSEPHPIKLSFNLTKPPVRLLRTWVPPPPTTPGGGRAGLHYHVAGSGPVLRLLYLTASLFFSTSQARRRKERRQLGPPHHSAPAICHFSDEMKPFMKRNEFPSNEAPQKLRD